MADQPQERKNSRRRSNQSSKHRSKSKKQSLASESLSEVSASTSQDVAPSQATDEAVVQVEAPPTVVAIDDAAPAIPAVKTSSFKRKGSKKRLKSSESQVFISIDDIRDGSDDEITYEPPPEDKTLPDLNYLIDTLETDQSELVFKGEPPSLFTRPEHVTSYKNISELRVQIEEEEIRRYVEDFEERIKDEVLMIGNISLEEVQEEEKRLRDEHIAYQSQQTEHALCIKQEIIIREELAKKHIADMLKEKRQQLQNREILAQQRERIMKDHLHKMFRQSENRLLNILHRRKAEVQAMYGDLQVADGDYGGSKGRRWKVDWTKTPQPVQVKLKTLRGVKDKLPGGRYVVVTSLYSRLGGHVMKWSNLKGQQWGGATLPLNHDGHFYNTEIKIDQSVFTVLPSKPSIRPSMVLVFELYLLRGAVVPTDRVVGWGCFPICDANFEVIEGKYKVPFLRGPIDIRIDKHEIIEQLVSSDLDHWFSNLYFEVVRLPRYLGGQKEFEVELQFSSSLLDHPDRIFGAEENRDGDDPQHGSSSSVGGSQRLNNAATTSSSDGSSLAVKETSNEKPLETSPDVKLDNNKKSLDEISVTKEADVWDRPMTSTMYGSRAVAKQKVAADSDTSDSEAEEIYLLDKTDDFKAIAGHPGLFYKRHLNTNPADTYHKKLFSLLPKTPLLTRRKPKRRLTRLEELELHTFSVQPPFSDKGHIKSSSNEKMNYVGRMFLTELGLSQWRSSEFWVMIFLFIFTFFLRVVLHYILQWTFLQAIGIPINKFEYIGYTVNLNYQSTLLRTREEVAVVMLGPLGNIVVFGILVFLSYVCQKILRAFPDLGSKIILVFGLMSFLDPILVLVVDCALKRYLNVGGDAPIADAAKLWWHFSRTQGTGLGGMFITISVYFVCMFFTAAILYMYFLRLHNNGRMLDIFWRLHGDESAFFMPYDLEMSNYELSFLCRKAEQWRGEEGARRKVAVYDYIWEEEEIGDPVWDDSLVPTLPKKQEITTHVSIHTLHLDGLRELHRHYLRLHDGAIVEVFGEMTVPGLDKDITSALTEGAQMIENLKESEVNLGKGRRPLTSWTTNGLDADERGTFFVSTGDVSMTRPVGQGQTEPDRPTIAMPKEEKPKKREKKKSK